MRCLPELSTPRPGSPGGEGRGSGGRPAVRKMSTSLGMSLQLQTARVGGAGPQAPVGAHTAQAWVTDPPYVLTEAWQDPTAAAWTSACLDLSAGRGRSDGEKPTPGAQRFCGSEPPRKRGRARREPGLASASPHCAGGWAQDHPPLWNDARGRKQRGVFSGPVLSVVESWEARSSLCPLRFLPLRFACLPLASLRATVGEA